VDRSSRAVQFSEWLAPPSWACIEFISDLHLAPETPRTVSAWDRYLQSTTANAVVILGDLFETWVGDDGRHRAFETHCVDSLARASRSHSLAFMAGNRDFLIGPDMLAACGMQRLADPTILIAFGRRLLLTHGDALCLADTEYQRFRQQVRNPAWQRDFLARPLEDRRAMARQMRAGSIERQSGRQPDDWIDIDPVAAVEWLHAAAAPTLIHGHTHRPATHSLTPGHVRHVLSDWHFDDDHRRAELLRLDALGVTRVALT
jgi:UDP-2,3-diacylglucosamine hydrolase